MAKKGIRKIEELTQLGLADVHIHTNHSDAKPMVREVLDYTENHTDLDIIAISDHDTMKGAFEAQELMKSGEYNFDLILGEEITSKQGHILGIFLKEEIKSGMSAEETVREIHRQKGLAIAAHPFERSTWNNQDLPIMYGVGYGTLRKIGYLFDGVEVVNATPTLGDVNFRAQLINNMFHLSEMGDSDAHIVEAIGMGYTLFEGKSSKDLKKAIVQHQTRAMSKKWTVLAVLKYAYFFFPHALRILWNTILHGRTKIPQE